MKFLHMRKAQEKRIGKILSKPGPSKPLPYPPGDQGELSRGYLIRPLATEKDERKGLHTITDWLASLLQASSPLFVFAACEGID